MDDNTNIWAEVFSPLATAIAFFGGLGGLVKALALRVSYRETLRVVIIGAATAFGLGTLSPHILKWLVGDVPEEIRTSLGTLCALAFIVGLIATALVERFIAKAEDHRNAQDES